MEQKNLYECVRLAAHEGYTVKVNLLTRYLVINGETYIIGGKLLDGYDTGINSNATELSALDDIYHAYEAYKYSVPTVKSDSRKSYFKALRSEELSDEQLFWGMDRDEAQAILEYKLLVYIINGALTWNPAWGSWFYQDDRDRDLIILKSWIIGGNTHE